jgi:hypothetical protein
MSTISKNRSPQRWNVPPPPRWRPQPGEWLFAFRRARDRAAMSCALRFHGQAYGWEAQFFARGDFLCGRGGFTTRALAIQWAEQERNTLEHD